MTISVTEDRLTEIICIVRNWEFRKHATSREVQSLIGKLRFAAHCVRSGWIFIDVLTETDVDTNIFHFTHSW